MSYCCLKPNLVKDVPEHTLEALKVCKHTREMITVAAASFIFAHMGLRIGLASTPKHSIVEFFALGRCGRILNNALMGLGISSNSIWALTCDFVAWLRQFKCCYRNKLGCCRKTMKTTCLFSWSSCSLFP